MRAIAAIALGLSEIMLVRSVAHVRRSAETLALRLGLVAGGAALGLTACGFFLSALYDATSAAWGAIAAKLVLGGILAFASLAVAFLGLVIRANGRALARRI